MEKLSNKKLFAVICGALVAFGSIALIAGGALTASAAEVAQSNQIILNAGAGTFSGSKEQAVLLTKDNKLPELPVPTREGWEFVGWVDSEVVENFWGDEESENPETDDYKLLKATYGDYKNVYYQREIVPVSSLDNNCDSGWKELTFNWISVTHGDPVKTGDEVSSSTLYAMYKPQTYTVYWHFNGWLNTFNAPHRTMPGHGGYFVEYELDKFSSLEWANHTFLGWYLDPQCTEEYKFTQVGAYKINEEAVEGDLHLYAKWESSAPFDGEVRIKKSSNLTEPKLNSTITVTCAYSLGESRDMPVITKWESSEPEAVVFVSCDPSKASAVFVISSTRIFEDGNKDVTIYVTVDGERYPAAEITVGHTWGGIVSEKSPTCTQAGYTVYGCKYCNETKVVSHEADGHRLIQTEHPATCTEDAIVETSCIVCGLTETKVVENSKLGHSWSNEIIADCSGTTVISTCLLCGLTQTSFDGNAVVHDWDTHYTVDRAATCAAEGEQSIHCRKCDAKQDVSPIPQTDTHEWSNWTVEREATTTETGLKSHTCEICGKRETQEIPVITPAPEEPEVVIPDPELPEPEVPEVVTPEPEVPEEVEKAETEEAVFAKSMGATNLSSDAQTEIAGGEGSILWIFALAGIVVLLICLGTVIFVIFRLKSKIK